MLYRFRITLNAYGDSDDHAEQFLDAFMDTHPEAGPVVSQNRLDDTMTVVFSLDADDHDQAWERGRPIFMDGARASGLPPADITEMIISRVVDIPEREAVLQGAC